MKNLVRLAAALLVGLLPAALPADDAFQLQIDQPLLPHERSSTAKLTRLPSARMWWNKDNRCVGISLKGDAANDRAVALASHLSGLRTMVLVAPPENRLTNSGLAPLARLHQLRLLSISGDRITDDGLVHVHGIQTLEALVLNGNFTDVSLELVSHLPNLRHLDLSQTQITDAGLVHLPALARIETLILNDTALTNSGLKHLLPLKTLKDLYLRNTALDDAAVNTLQQMEQLELLFILDTNISADGVAKLQTALLPSCEIVHQSGTYHGQKNPNLAMAQPPDSPWRSAR